MASYQTLRLILGDQLNLQHSWLQALNNDVLYVIAQLRQETDYTRHHVQKLCGFFAAMDAFAQTLQTDGHRVLHLTLDDTAGYEDLNDLLTSLCQQYKVNHLEYQQPDEYRVAEQLKMLQIDSVSIHCCDSEHFLLPFDEIGKYFPGGKTVRMESFYRKMRKRFDILMAAGEPAGGKWNYDQQNRNRLKKDDLAHIPPPLIFEKDVTHILDNLNRHKVACFGKATSMLELPINRQQSLALLDYFCEHLLPNFGFFQDAMTSQSEHKWSLYHSRLSFALNLKILSPGEVIDAVLDTYKKSRGTIDIAQAEGFIRQVLGWREYIRGMYWANMPQYEKANELDAKRALPGFFWNAKTNMRCMQESIQQSLDHAYAHHIQRLMITGNFALLAGIDPQAVDEWYLGIYADALQWVELPNTRGMSQYADGGLIASKPYAASGNYINKMSDYCKGCHYDVKQRETENACPFNSLYWKFIDQHHERFAGNQRMRMIVRGWEQRPAKEKKQIIHRADSLLERLDTL